MAVSHNIRRRATAVLFALATPLVTLQTAWSDDTPPDTRSLSQQRNDALQDIRNLRDRLRLLREQEKRQQETIAGLRNLIEERIAELASRTEPHVTESDAANATHQLVSHATPHVVVIEGDQGAGTGFLCKEGGQVWVYTAAHVISGNNTVTVRDHHGRTYQEFEFMEVAENVDLVRLKLKNQDLPGFELASQAEAPEIGDMIVAIGNSLGAGALSGEAGRVTGLDDEMWEVSAGVIPGNSGGPVLANDSGKVIGIVTHLIISRRDGAQPSAEDTRITRFAARLDKPREWRRMQVSRFVNEWKYIDNMFEETCIAWASANTVVEHINRHFDPDARRFPKVPAEVAEITSANSQHIHVQRAKSWIREMDRSTRTNRNQALDRADALIQQILADIRPKPSDPKAADFSWYHRQKFEQQHEWRTRLTQRDE